MTDRYPPETLDPDDDNGTMPDNVAKLGSHVIGHRIVSAEQRDVPNDWGGSDQGLAITLDDGTTVALANSYDCCAYTELASFLLDPAAVDHIITGVGTTEGYTVWHIYADWGDILRLQVGWGCGNPFYYGYGFDIHVVPAPEAVQP